MKALSIKQHWLYAITDLDKRVENRSWEPPAWVIGQRIALHASKQPDRDSVEAIQRISGHDLSLVPVPLGMIVATVVITGYESYLHYLETTTEEIDKWFFGPVGWLLDDIQKLDSPIPARGQLGLWEIHPAAERAIMKELHRRGKSIWLL